MKGNLILIHGGGPTAVINASLAGAIRQAKKEPGVDRILAAIGGTGGLMRGQVRDLTDITEEELALLERTPGSAIGTSRDALEEPEYRLLAEKCVEFGAKYVLMNGGNGTMDACGKLCATLEGTGIRVMGIPKTMDNDIAVTDHAPGFGSAARYIAQSVAEVTVTRGPPIHVVVIEASGRNAGWITAASALARQAGVDGPDLIYLPERPFDEEQYLRDVQKLIEEKRGVVVVASEGLKDKDGKPIVEPVFQVGRATYFGDVSAHLANLVIKRLGYKARSEKPGLLGRASIALSSDVDRAEAILAGEEAVRAACAGESGKMVGFIRESASPYKVRTTLIDVHDVMLVEKKMLDAYINEAGNGVTQAFLDWCAPLIGEPLGRLISLR
ncbi:MAG: diphosphate--fructose-6-phosphate 1-phosphotransferase [Christensenellales bacterium]